MLILAAVVPFKRHVQVGPSASSSGRSRASARRWTTSTRCVLTIHPQPHSPVTLAPHCIGLPTLTLQYIVVAQVPTTEDIREIVRESVADLEERFDKLLELRDQRNQTRAAPLKHRGAQKAGGAGARCVVWAHFCTAGGA
eukprot:2410245-Prymnesium_polylepis.2